MVNLIAISGKQYSGKDQLADFLLADLPDFRKVPIAKAIKAEFAALYGLTPQDIEANKATYRTGLIILGQRRRQQDPTYWIQQVLAQPGPKIISDMRMREEYKTLKAHGAFCIRVEAERPLRTQRGKLVAEDDPTECELDAIVNWDAVVYNNGTLADLKQQARWLSEKIKRLAG